jgi:hypothetical protein
MEDLKNTFHTPCGHVFCRDCAREWFKQSHSCPTCRQSVHGSTEGSEASLPPPPGYRRMRRRGYDASATEALVARDHQIAQELLRREMQIDEFLPPLMEAAEDQERLQYVEYAQRHGRRGFSPSQGGNETPSPLADFFNRRDRFLPASNQPCLNQWLADQPPVEAQEPVPDSDRSESFLERRRRRQEISETLPGGNRASAMSPTGSTRPLGRRETFPDHRRGHQTAHGDKENTRRRDRWHTQHHPEGLNLPARPTRTPSRCRPTNTQQPPSAALLGSQDRRSSFGGDIHIALIRDGDEFPPRLTFSEMEPTTLHILSPDRRRRTSNAGITSSPLSTLRPRVTFTHPHHHNHQHHQRDRGGGGGSSLSGSTDPLNTSASAAAAHSRDYRLLRQGGGELLVVTELGRSGSGGGRGRRSPTTMEYRGSRRMDYFFGPPR